MLTKVRTLLLSAKGQRINTKYNMGKQAFSMEKETMLLHNDIKSSYMAELQERFSENALYINFMCKRVILQELMEELN